jgi:hypothetical protein
MKEYKGYYIDNVFFNSEEEIDKHIMDKAVERHTSLAELFATAPSFALSKAMDDSADRLFSLGLSFEDIERIEITAMA